MGEDDRSMTLSRDVFGDCSRSLVKGRLVGGQRPSRIQGPAQGVVL